MEATEQPNENKQITIAELNIEILATIYEIIRSIEKYPYDNAAKVRESEECSQKVLELQNKIGTSQITESADVSVYDTYLHTTNTIEDGTIACYRTSCVY